MKYKQFIFEDYVLDPHQKLLTLQYSLDGQLHFQETFRFDFPFAQYDPQVLDCALQNVFFMVGVSYFKTYLPPEIVVRKGSLAPEQAAFFGKTYQRGLGEFFYLNQLDPHTPITFPSSKSSTACGQPESEGLLVGIGGGKDSLVSVEILRQNPNLKLATWSVGHRSQLEPLIQTIGLPHFWVEREWDRQLLELNQRGAYNGHIPISAILASVGTVVAVLTGYRDVVVSNESSTSEPNLTWQNTPINHQYSKSLEFEQDYQKHLHDQFGDSLQYYSFLRPLSEVRIAEIFAKIGFDKYEHVFSSCNRAYTHDSHAMYWCGVCPKCAFVFLAFSPFIQREKLEQLFHGKNLLLDPALEPTYRQLLGIQGNKPLECVGEVKESRTAMHLAQQQYPELTKYQFDLPTDYDYKSLSPHAMPEDLYLLLQQVVA